jgi:hypothetical protein
VRCGFRRREDTSASVVTRCSVVSALTTLNQTNRKVLKKKHSGLMTEKCYKENNLLFLSIFPSSIANEEIN